MKKLGIIISFCLVAFSIQAQDQQDAMKAWMESISPGPMHKMLAKMAGEWKTVTIFTDPTSGGETKSEGNATCEVILGGRYLKSIHSGFMMGMPFEGMGLDAYDNLTKEFVSVWVDNMGTGVMVMKGKYNEKSNSFVYTGEAPDPMSGQMMNYRSVTKWINDNKVLFEMYSGMSGQEMKMFTMEYTRK